MHRTPVGRPERPGILIVVAVACYAALVLVPPAVFLARREAWLAAVDRPAVRAAWDDFRSDMRRQSGLTGPVQHKVPRSAEPPLVVWLRDHPWLAVAAWVILGGTLGLMILGMAVGVARTGAHAAVATGSPAENESPRDRHGDEQHHGDAQHTEE